MQQSKFSPKRQNDEKSESPSPNEKKNKTYEKFRTRSFLAKLSYYQSKFKFTENELLMIKKRFIKISSKGFLSKTKFRESLGILGVENAVFLSDQIFLNIDDDGDGMASLEDFLKYMDSLINGNEYDKALLSFRILDTGRKGKIIYEDIEKMLYGISVLWNSITGSKIIPKKEYIDYIFNTLDHKGKREILFKDFLTVYKEDPELYCWFEFFNQDDLVEENLIDPIKKKLFSKIQEQKNKKPINNKIITNNLNEIESEIQKCLFLISNEREKENNIKPSSEKIEQIYKNSEFSNSKYSQNTTFSTNFRHHNSPFKITNYTAGPFFLNSPSNYKEGDYSPSPEEMSLIGKIEEESDFNSLKTNNNNNNPLLIELTDKLKCLLNKSENTRKEILKPNDENEKEKENENIGEKSKKKFNLLSGLNIPRDISVNRRSTVRNMPSVSKKKKEGQKKNMSVYFGHENWNLVLNMMIGVRTSIKSIYEINENHPVEEYEYKMKGHFELIQKRITGFDVKMACKFYDYAPNVFERIRKKFGISGEIYLRSIGPENLLGSIIMGNLASLTELISSGKSGSFFYFTGDSKFMLKTISKNEFSFFRRILKPYYNHLMNNENSLMTKIYGLHKIKVYQSKKKSENIYFVIMANLFLTPFELDLRYDLKGSKYGRCTREPNKPWEKSVALKDLDFLNDNAVIDLNDDDKQLILKQIENDILFFKLNHIIDYSLLIGIHKLTIDSKKTFGFKFEKDLSKKFYENFQGGILSKDKSTIFYIGIIDILTEYGTKKKFEYGFKKAFLGGQISCIPPYEYGDRFKNFMKDYVFL